MNSDDLELADLTKIDMELHYSKMELRKAEEFQLRELLQTV